MPVYVNKVRLYEMLVEYHKTKDRKVYNEIGKDFLLIAKNYLNKSNFINYSEDRKQEMISDAVYYMCKCIDRDGYDFNQKDPFSYFTSFVVNSTLQYINERKKIDKMFTSIEYIENFNDSDSLSLDAE